MSEKQYTAEDMVDARMKLTDTQLKIINNLWMGQHPLHGAVGQAQHGGWDRALRALIMKGVVSIQEDKSYGLTEVGRQAALHQARK